MKRYKKQILQLLSVLCILLALGIGFEIFRNRELQARLRYLRVETDTAVIQQIGLRDVSDVRLAGEELKELFSLLKLRRPYVSMVCACAGDLRVTFYRQENVLSSFTYHHDKSQVRGLDLPVGYIDIRSGSRENLQHFFERHQFHFGK